MTQQATSNPLPPILLRARDGLILHQTLYVAAKLGVADCLEGCWRSAAELARQLEVNEDALYRTLRLLASQGVFEENNARCFRNNEVSNFLRTGVPGSVRSLFIFWGSDFHYPSFGQIMHSIKTGESSRTLLSGTDGFEHLRRDPEQARIFDDAMTNMSQLVGPAIAAAYDFGAWGSLMDVGGGNGILLSHILRTHPGLRGVLAENVPSNGKFIDIVMLILTGGRERSVDEYRELLASTGFRLNRVVPTAAQFAVIEALPV